MAEKRIHLSSGSFENRFDVHQTSISIAEEIVEQIRGPEA
jgi:hypothetical protein